MEINKLNEQLQKALSLDEKQQEKFDYASDINCVIGEEGAILFHVTFGRLKFLNILQNQYKDIYNLDRNKVGYHKSILLNALERIGVLYIETIDDKEVVKIDHEILSKLIDLLKNECVLYKNKKNIGL